MTDQTNLRATDHLQLNTSKMVTSRIAEELIVLDLEESAYLSVSATGTFIWPLLETGTTRAALIASIIAEFDIDRATAEQDLDHFLSDLSARQLLQE